jgi:predicted secreted protein
MQWLGSFFIFIVLWWVVVFTVLPWGTKPLENPGLGHDRGAPAVPYLKRKLLITTLITLVLWGIGVFLILRYHLSLTMLERPE